MQKFPRVLPGMSVCIHLASCVAHNTGIPEVEPANRMTPSPDENQWDVCVEPRMDIGDNAIVREHGETTLRLTGRMTVVFLLQLPLPVPVW